MGWIMLSKPGTECGPCVGKCKHKDCAENRSMAATPCVYCDKPIGYDTKYYSDTTYDDDGKLTARIYYHFICGHKQLVQKTA